MSTPVDDSGQGESPSLYNGPTDQEDLEPSEPSIRKVKAREGSSITKLPELLNESNWMTWRERMKRVLRLCSIEPYVAGKVKVPIDAKGAENWEFNDIYAQTIIVNNISSTEIVHVSQCDSAKAIWDSLEAVHESKGHQTIVSVIRNLFQTKAEEDSDINEHLNKLKQYWERINQMNEEDFRISDVLFKIIISSSLPLSWDTFTESYVGGRKGMTEIDPKKLMGSQQFIGILKEEYQQKQLRAGKSEVNQAYTPKRSLQNRLTSKPGTSSDASCKHCGRNNHMTIDCKHLGKSKCAICGKFGHTDDKCWNKGKNKRKNEKEDDGRNRKKRKKEETNEAEEDSDEEEITLNIEEVTEDTPEEGETSTGLFDPGDEHYNFNSDNTYNMNQINEPLIYYDWFGDSATTSHVSNRRDIFSTYQPLHNTSVVGVGRLKAKAEGKGTIELESRYKNKMFILKLENVLHIPTNRNNLISLGKWDAAGGRYIGGGGKIILENKNKTPVAIGTKADNNLYKMKLKTRIPRENHVNKQDHNDLQTFMTTTPTQSWETWHRRYGHVGYSGLQKLVDRHMVDGFTVDVNSSKPDCETCVQAKQTREPFKGISDKNTKAGELTHIDLWGKYETQSIHGNQYYILFVDDATRYVTVHFLKRKDEAAMQIKNYLTYLKTQGKPPKAIRIDRGSEFLNQPLKSWFNENGLEFQTTAPYSPSQNGVAERMNRTLVELGRAMMKGQNLPEFLWEYAIANAAYLRNRSYTTFLKSKTPYQMWYNIKPNIEHLREFGAPVWVMLQGQNKPRKMLPKSQRRAYVGYDDGSKSIKYYNAETRKVLNSRNYRFLYVNKESPPEEIEVAPDLPHEGETVDDMLPTGSNSQKRKRVEEEEQLPRSNKRAKRVDYRYLNDPFEDEIEEENENQPYIDPLEVPKSLKEAKGCDEWEQWDAAVKLELDQLVKTGTWTLVEKPEGAVPIKNKWVFDKKTNKAGEIIRYKARLVAKGCSQRPGHDYQETFSPVVRMETIRAILSMVPIKGLKIQQMDVKGAYLNGILQEKIYMQQPEGYDDGSGRVCLLVKTLYGLKQSGREWNRELDTKLKEFGFHPLRSDPCAYVRRNGKDLEIITVWVDDLLLFATSNDLLEKMKKELQSKWTVTDMGEPAKIIGIEITINDDSILISQEKYIDAILKREGMDESNPVSMPMDPNDKIKPNPDGNEGSKSNSYAKLLGELQFLTNATRPDIAYAVNKLSAYTANPSLQHVGAAKRILRYLKGTKKLAIKYSAKIDDIPKENSNLFYGYADAAYGNSDDYKSTSGYVFIVGGGAITWRSKKQTTIALSSTEAEYIALSEAGREACWLRSLYEELGYTQESPNVIKGDNDGSIAMARNPQFHKRSKHIATRWHWVRDLVQDKIISIESCRDPEQTADVLTKPLARQKHQKHLKEMGLITI
jgi:transposase InsO family protein